MAYLVFKMCRITTENSYNIFKNRLIESVELDINP
jgi:hypothetical protein